MLCYTIILYYTILYYNILCNVILLESTWWYRSLVATSGTPTSRQADELVRLQKMKIVKDRESETWKNGEGGEKDWVSKGGGGSIERKEKEW